MKKLTIATIVLLALASNFAYADGTKKPDPYKKSFEQQSESMTFESRSNFFGSAFRS